MQVGDMKALLGTGAFPTWRKPGFGCGDIFVV